MLYKEATERSQANQETIDGLAREARKGWWAKKRERFLQPN
jgi:hypothetical protein